MLRHSVTPFRPSRICTSFSDTLLFVDYSQGEEVIVWLDCSTNPPNIQKTTVTTSPNWAQGVYVRDICFVDLGDMQLIVKTDWNGISAFNTNTEETEWHIKGALGDMKEPMHPRGIAIDGHQHLFVCDRGNNSIQLFSVASGKYLGAMIVYDKPKVGKVRPLKCRWCENTSSLIVVRESESKCFLDIFKYGEK